MLEVIGLACSRNDVELFANLSFKLPSGVALQLRAPNGVGKTTLLKTIVGLLPATSGNIIRLKSLIYLGHKTNLHPALSPKENLQFLYSINDSGSILTAQQLAAALNFASLTSLQDLPCDDLSAGQCQRINLARLYLATANLWVLDEPFINLDMAARGLLHQLCIKHLAAGGSILIATHYDLEIPNIQTLYLENYA